MTEKQGDKQLKEAIKKVGENPGYKVLTKEEYDILMKGAIPKTSTPRVPLTPQPPYPLFRPRTHGTSPISRLQQLIGSPVTNQSFAAVHAYHPPKLPFSVALMNQIKGKLVTRFGIMKSSVFRIPNTSQSMCSYFLYAPPYEELQWIY